ncbi:MAG: hypothetical protein KGJ68_10860 [Gammaproteobacteria bacterium]|nr:hypothetical protein [Gammaproteobacteria bacterium]
MALPPHLAKYDSLIDFIVEQLVREATESPNEKPAASWQTSPRAGDQHEHSNNADSVSLI